MLEKIVEKFCDSPAQYRHLLQTEKLVEKRALEGKNDLSNMSLALTCVICFTISVIYTFLPFMLPLDTFTYALIGITMSMMMLGIWTIPYFDTLLSPINYPVIAHTPVSSRTYFLVKLTRVLHYALLLLASLNLLPALGGIQIHTGKFSFFQLIFPVVYLSIAFISGFFTIGVMATFAGYLTKLYTIKPLRNIAQYAQFIFPSLFPVTFLILSRLLPDMSKQQLTSALKWLYLFPNGWFAGTVSLALGHIEPHFLISAGLAVAATLFLVLVPLRSIARSYSEYLSYLLESGSRQKPKIRVRTPLLARMFRNWTIRAGLCLSAVYMYRDRHILRQFFAALGMVIVNVMIFTQGGMYILKWPNNPNAIGLSPGFTILFTLAGIGVVGSFISPVRYSEHYKASWMLKLAPISAPFDLWRGVQATTSLHIVAPCTFLMLCIATVIWGVLGIFYVLPVAIILLNFVIFYPKPHSGLPLALEFVHNQGQFEALIPFLLSCLIIGVFIGIQLVAYLLNIWLYYGFYCTTVVGGLICSAYFLKQNASRKI